MKIFKNTGNYQKIKARTRQLLVIFCIVVFAILFLSSFRILPFYVDFGEYEVARGLFMVVPVFMGLIWWREYTTFKKGLGGENDVTEELKSGLPDDYYLINDFIFKDPYYGKKQNIDHILLCSRVVFVIETKNYRGTISCQGDLWVRKSGGKIGSPSKQAKWNAVAIKEIIESLEQFKSRNLWIQPIVVFSNNDVDLKLEYNTVEIKKLDDLLDYLTIKYDKKNHHFSLQDLDLIKEEILRRTL